MGSAIINLPFGFSMRETSCSTFSGLGKWWIVDVMTAISNDLSGQGKRFSASPTLMSGLCWESLVFALSVALGEISIPAKRDGVLLVRYNKTSPVPHPMSIIELFLGISLAKLFAHEMIQRTQHD